MNLVAQLIRLARRIAQILKDPGWDDLGSYLLPGYTGTLVGKVRLGIITIRGLIDGEFAEQNYMTQFTSNLPSKYRALAGAPNQMAGAGSVSDNGAVGAAVATVMMSSSGALQFKTAGAVTGEP